MADPGTLFPALQHYVKVDDKDRMVRELENIEEHGGDPSRLRPAMLLQATISGSVTCLRHLLAHLHEQTLHPDLLVQAVIRDFVAVAECLLSTDSTHAFVNSTTESASGMTPLMAAVHSNATKCVKYLVSRVEVSIESTVLDGLTAAHLAAYGKQAEMLRLLLPRYIEDGAFTSVHEVARVVFESGDRACIDELLRPKVNRHFMCSDLLWFAAVAENDDPYGASQVIYHPDSFLQLWSANSEGNTAVYEACRHQKWNCAYHILCCYKPRMRGDLIGRRPHQELSLLMWVILSRSDTLLKCVLDGFSGDAAALLLQTSKTKRVTAAMCAAEVGNVQALCRLLEFAGGKVAALALEVTDADGRTARQIAVTSENKDVVAWLDRVVVAHKQEVEESKQ